VPVLWPVGREAALLSDSPCHLGMLAESGWHLAAQNSRQKVPDPLSCTLNTYVSSARSLPQQWPTVEFSLEGCPTTPFAGKDPAVECDPAERPT